MVRGLVSPTWDSKIESSVSYEIPCVIFLVGTVVKRHPFTVIFSVQMHICEAVMIELLHKLLLYLP